MWMAIWRLRALALRRDAFALFLSLLDGRVPPTAKLLTLAVVVYTVSPVDLLPDVVPLLGFLDDLGIVAGGVLAARGLIPPAIFDEHRREVDRRLSTLMRVATAAALVIGAVTLLIAWRLLK